MCCSCRVGLVVLCLQCVRTLGPLRVGMLWLVFSILQENNWHPFTAWSFQSQRLLYGVLVAVTAAALICVSLKRDGLFAVLCGIVCSRLQQVGQGPEVQVCLLVGCWFLPVKGYPVTVSQRRYGENLFRLAVYLACLRQSMKWLWFTTAHCWLIPDLWLLSPCSLHPHAMLLLYMCGQGV